MSNRSRHGVTDALPWVFPGFGEQAGLDLPELSPRTERQILDRLMSRDFDAWSLALARVGNCAHPIRLRGRSDTIDAGTGEVLSTCSSQHEALG